MKEKTGRIFRRKDGKYLIYLPLAVATDSMFPWSEEMQRETSVKVKVGFKIGEDKLIISKA